MISLSVKSSGYFPTLEELEDLAEPEVRDFVRNIFEAAVSLSPVLTGRYRASWRIGLNQADSYAVPRQKVTTAPLPEPRFHWPAGFKMGDSIVISNSVPYAELIEDGWSDQAPTGVLTLAVAMATLGGSYVRGYTKSSGTRVHGYMRFKR